MASAVTVDFVAKGEGEGVWLMILVEQGPWSAPYDAPLRKLQERLYGCVEAAIDGKLAEKFPQTKGRRIRIRVDAYEVPHKETQAFFDRFSSNVLRLSDYAQALARSDKVSGIEFEIRFVQIH